jgi:hypothetical protein
MKCACIIYKVLRSYVTNSENLKYFIYHINYLSSLRIPMCSESWIPGPDVAIINTETKNFNSNEKTREIPFL